MFKRNIIVPSSAAEEDAQIDSVDALNDMLAGVQNNGESSADEAAPEQPTGDDAQSGVQVDDSQDDAEKPEHQKRTQEDKANYAFAQQRAEIAELTELLTTMADANGIKYENKKDLVAKLKDKALVERATQQNIPVELLREVEQLRADSNAWKQYQHEQNAMAGFSKVAAEFGLQQSDLESFAVELDQAGKNPFTQNVDVVAEYKARHLDEIVARKVQAAVEAALKGDAQAALNSSTPSRAQGTGSSEGNEKISTIAQLNALLGG